MEAFAIGTPSLDLFDATLLDVRALLTKTHGWPVDDSDLAGMTQIAEAFFESGPALRYSMRSFRRDRPFPTYAELMTAADQNGVGRSFLATEESYQALREMQQRNLIVPVVGDFAGAKALKAVGAYLEAHDLEVTAFYTSNVEFYLFRNDDWRRFYDNLAALPSNRRSVLVRSLFRGMGGFPGSGSRGGMPGGGGFGLFYPGGSLEGRLVLDPIPDLVAAVRRGNIRSYSDIFARGPQEAR
jgi:hypothetical protein